MSEPERRKRVAVLADAEPVTRDADVDTSASQTPRTSKWKQVQLSAAEVVHGFQGPPKPKMMDDSTNRWSIPTWIESIGTANELIARALTSELPSSTSGTQQLAFVREYLGQKEPEAAKAEILRLFRAHRVEEYLADAIAKEALKLASQQAATSSELHAKFVQEQDAFTLDFKGLSSFYSGLEGVVGPPQPNLLEGMRRDHCKSDDSRVEFVASNYGHHTTSEIEWWFVTLLIPDDAPTALWPPHDDFHLVAPQRAP